MRSLLGLGLGLTSLVAVGCNVTQEGAIGTVLFTPDDCGRAEGCDFRDSIGAGGAINVQIEGADGVSTVGLDLVSSDPTVFDVTRTKSSKAEPMKFSNVPTSCTVLLPKTVCAAPLSRLNGTTADPMPAEAPLKSTVSLSLPVSVSTSAEPGVRM